MDQIQVLQIHTYMVCLEAGYMRIVFLSISKEEKTMKRIFLVLLLLTMSLSGCHGKPRKYYPQDGVWVCDELRVQLCFDPENYNSVSFYEDKLYLQMDDDAYYTSMIEWNGQIFRCSAHCPWNTPYLYIQYDDPRFNETQYKAYDIGYHFYETEIISLSDDKMVLKDLNTKEKYVFVRLD